VCEKLNIARGTVYQYFGNKRENLYAILESVEENIDDIHRSGRPEGFFKDQSGPEVGVEVVPNGFPAAINVIMSEPIVIKLIYQGHRGN
jgi:AcrR family transcriptional regulator